MQGLRDPPVVRARVSSAQWTPTGPTGLQSPGSRQQARLPRPTPDARAGRPTTTGGPVHERGLGRSRLNITGVLCQSSRKPYPQSRLSPEGRKPSAINGRPSRPSPHAQPAKRTCLPGPQEPPLPCPCPICGRGGQANQSYGQGLVLSIVRGPESLPGADPRAVEQHDHLDGQERQPPAERGVHRWLSRYAPVVEPGRTIIRTTTISQARANRPVIIDKRGSRATRDSTAVDACLGLSSWVTTPS